MNAQYYALYVKYLSDLRYISLKHVWNSKGIGNYINKYRYIPEKTVAFLLHCHNLGLDLDYLHLRKYKVIMKEVRRKYYSHSQTQYQVKQPPAIPR